MLISSLSTAGSLSKGLTARPLEPGKPYETALQELLEGTGLKYEFVNAHTITIARIKTAPNALHAGSAATSSGIATTAAEAASEDVLVTGTNIPGLDPLGDNVLKMSRIDIGRIGYSTVQDVLRTQPQFATRGPCESSTTAGSLGLQSLGNLSRACGLNSRGLGAGSTLVLLNGRRLAPGAADGRYVDVSMIPLIAVERIEILPAGASAIYGSDAEGGVVNLILRRKDDGAETQLRMGSATRGGPDEKQASQVFANQWATGNALVAVEVYRRAALPLTARERSAMSDQRRHGGAVVGT